MVYPGMASALETPRTNIGDATYLQQPELDMSQEVSFESPTKDDSQENLFAQLRGGRAAAALRTPRARGPLADRRNMQDIGPEFTPLLKSAGRPGRFRRRGKENENMPGTPPALLSRIEEDLTPIPALENSTLSRSLMSIDMPVQQSSVSSTPLALPPRRNFAAKTPFDDGNQLSLKEQENVIDKIEKENFGLKLKIHFLEEALRKAGPGFSEAALRENTELKVDKVTMQRDLQRHKKQLNSAEKDLEAYRQQLIDMQEQSKRKYADESLKADLDSMREALQQKDAEIEHLQAKLEHASSGNAQVDKLRDEITDLEADLREKERLISEHQDEIDDLRDQQRKATGSAATDKLHDALEEKDGEIEDLKQMVRDQERTLDEKETELMQLQDRLRDREHELSNKDGEMGKLHFKAKRLAEREAEIEALTEKVRLSRTVEQQSEELQDQLRRVTAREADKDAEIEALRAEVRRQKERGLEAEQLRDRMRSLEGRDSEAEQFERQLIEAETRFKNDQRVIAELENRCKAEQRRVLELEQRAQTGNKASDELELARDTIDDLERKVRQLETESDDLRDKMEEAQAERERAEADLEELHEELAHKSPVTKGLSRQMEERVARLQAEVDQAGHDYAALEKQYEQAMAECEELRLRGREVKRERDSYERDFQTLRARYGEMEVEAESLREHKNHLQAQNDQTTTEALALQRENARLRKLAGDLETNLAREKEHVMDIDSDARDVYRADLERLNNQVGALQAHIREREALFETEVSRSESEKRSLEAARELAEEKIIGLQHAIDRLRQAGNSLTTKETRLQDSFKEEVERHKREEATLNRRIDELEHALELKQTSLAEMRAEAAGLRDDLRRQQNLTKAEIEKGDALADEVEVLQAALEEDAELAAREKEELKTQIDSLRSAASAATRAYGAGLDDASSRAASSATLERLRTQLADSSANAARAAKDKHALQDQVAAISAELKTLRTTLAEVRAERDELETEIQAVAQREDAYRADHERLELRTARAKLDAEVRRLRDANQDLEDRRAEAERTLEYELSRAAAEEDRLSQEITRLRQQATATGSESLEMATARRTIRELERRVADLQVKLATAADITTSSSDGELAIVRRDLAAARQKELEYVSRDASHKDTVRSLKKQIAELEQRVHEADINNLMAAPAVDPLAESTELADLRRQLATATHGLNDAKTRQLAAERTAAAATADLRRQLADVEDERTALEDALEDARREAEDALAMHDRDARQLQLRLQKAQHEAATAVARAEQIAQADLRDASTSAEAKALKRQLRAALAEADALEHDVRMQFDTIESLTVSETALRKKLERTRAERAAFRAAAEKLARDVHAVQAVGEDQEREVRQLQEELARVAIADAEADDAQDEDEDEEDGVHVVADAERHRKEVKGMVLQMQWMQARWEREADKRADAAFAKRFLMLQLEVAQACNTAQLRELEHIRTNILGNKAPLPTTPSSPRPSFKAVAILVRFVVRTQRAAAAWAPHKVSRARIADAVADMKRRRRADGIEKGAAAAAAATASACMTAPGEMPGEAAGRRKGGRRR